MKKININEENINAKSFMIQRVFIYTFGVFLLTTFTSTVGLMIDGIVIGRCLGATAIASYGMISPFQMCVDAIAIVIATGTQTICANSYGRGDVKHVESVFSLSCVAIAMISILFSLVSVLFADQIVSLLGLNGYCGNIVNMTKQYIIGYSIGVPGIMCVALLQPMMQLDNDRRRVSVAAIVISITNIIGDISNVYVFKGGMFGMGITTAISYYCGLIVLIIHFYKRNRGLTLSLANIQCHDMINIVRNGAPSAVNRASGMIRNIIINYVIISIAGEAGAAAFGVMSAFTFFMSSIPRGIGAATLVTGGVIFGEKDEHELETLIRTAVRVGMCLTIVFGAAVFIFSPLITSIYMSSSLAIYPEAVKSIRYYAFTITPYMINLVIVNYYQCSGHLKMANIIQFFDDFVFIILLVFAVTPFLKMEGIWFSFLFGKILTELLIVLVTWCKNNKISFRLEYFLLLPKEFDVPKEDSISFSVRTSNQVAEVSMAVEAFCTEHGIDERRKMHLALCIEEMTSNIISYGFADGKTNYIDIRVFIRNNDITLRIMDNCRFFNPKQQAEISNPNDCCSNIGIRMVMKMAKKVDYVNVLNLNNLIVMV